MGDRRTVQKLGNKYGQMQYMWSSWLTFTELYIKQSLHIANTETFQLQKRCIFPGSTRKKITVDSL